jgi:acyl-CoA synthetase (AMP-forming)/AMP-acid ligase II
MSSATARCTLETSLDASTLQDPQLEDIIRPFGNDVAGLTFIDLDDNRTRISYQEMARHISGAAMGLGKLGVQPGDLVATTITNDLPSVVTALAVWAAGATLISLPPRRRRPNPWHDQQFARVLETMGCGYFMTEDDDASALSPRMRAVNKFSLYATEAPGTVTDFEIPETALVQFTSGSISAPKGVAIGRETLTGHLNMLCRFFQLDGTRDRCVSWLPLYHDMGLIILFLASLTAQVDQVFLEPRTFALRPASWLTLLGREGGTFTAAPNFGLRLAAQVPYPDDIDLSRTRVCICGGERVQQQTLVDFAEATEPLGLPWGALSPGYGLAEGTVGVSTQPVGRGPVFGPGGHVSVGHPLPGVSLHVAPGAEPTAIGLGGQWLFDGYHTSTGFMPRLDDVFETGDAGFWHDGELYVLGRFDEVLSMAGRNIFAEDIEAVVLQASEPLVRNCAAFRPSDSHDRFALVVEADSRLRKSPDEAEALLRRMQALIAATVEVRVTPAVLTYAGGIPRTTSGKVQRKQCRVAYESGAITAKQMACVD